MLVQEIDGIFDWREVGDGDEARVGDLRISFSRTDHPPVTHAVRVEGAGGRTGVLCRLRARLVLEALGPGLDLALCEATYTDDFQGNGRRHDRT